MNICRLHLKYFRPLIRKSTFMLLKSSSANSMCTNISNSTNKTNFLISVCIERLPVIAKPMTEIETKFAALQEKLEFEGSLQSDHEIRKENELKGKKQDLSEDAPILQTVQEFEDAGVERFKKIQFASRITEADEKNITNTTNRKLDHSLFLVAEQKFGDSIEWIPPQGVIKEGETAKQAAERLVKSFCGEKFDVKFFGNTPIAISEHYFEEEKAENKNGSKVKVFYFLSKYLNGAIESKNKFQWLSEEELKQLLPLKMYNSLSPLLNISK